MKQNIHNSKCCPKCGEQKQRPYHGESYDVYCPRCKYLWSHDKSKEGMFDDWFDRNFFYCEDTHSFVHRFYYRLKKKMPEDYHGAQNIAFEVYKEMADEFHKKKGENVQNP